METEDPLAVMETRVKVEDPDMWQPPMLVLLPEFNTEDELCDGNMGGVPAVETGLCGSQQVAAQMMVQQPVVQQPVVEQPLPVDPVSLFPVKSEPIEEEEDHNDPVDVGEDREKCGDLPKIVLTMSLSGQHRALIPAEVPPSARGMFSCSCGKVYMHKGSLSKHVARSTGGKKTGKSNRKKGRRKAQKAQIPNREMVLTEYVGVSQSGKMLTRKVNLAVNGKRTSSRESARRALDAGNGAVSYHDREKESGKRTAEKDTPVVHKAVNEGTVKSLTGWYYCTCGKAFCYNSSLLKHIKVSTERSALAPKRKQSEEPEPRVVKRKQSEVEPNVVKRKQSEAEPKVAKKKQSEAEPKVAKKKQSAEAEPNVVKRKQSAEAAPNVKRKQSEEAQPNVVKRNQSDQAEPNVVKSTGTVFMKEDQAERAGPTGHVVSLADIISFCRTGNMAHRAQPDNFECFCGKIFPNVSSLVGHVHSSAKADPWHCLMSGELSQKSDMLSQYSEMQRKPQPTVGKYHKCNVCNQWFAFLTNLRAHQLQHEKESEKQKESEKEKEKEKQKESQKEKVKESPATNSVHSIPTPNPPSALTEKPMPTKAKEKSKSKLFKCDVCKRQFPHLSHLKTHQRLHERDKNIADSVYHECDLCGKRFGLVSHLKAHLSKIHPDVEKSALAPTNVGSIERKRMRLFRKSDIQLPTSLQQDSKAKTLSEEASGEAKDGEWQDTIPSDAQGEALPKKRGQRSSLSLSSVSDAAPSSEEFVCHCGSVIKSSSSISQHIKEHRAKGELCCKECGKVFLDQSLYERHCKFHSQKSVCRVCNASFRFHREYTVHRLAHWGSIATCCGRCGYKFKVRDVDVVKYCCKPCEKLMKQSGGQEGRDEEIVCDNSGKEAECEICHTSFQDFGELQRHWPSHAGDCVVLLNRIEEIPKTLWEDCQSQNETDSTPLVESVQPMSLSECGTGGADSNVSVQRPLKKLQFQCRCQKKFNTRFQLKNHKCDFTQGTRCSECNIMFRKKSSFVRHMQRHAGIFRYKCNICEQSFPRLRALQRHKKTHNRGKGTNPIGGQTLEGQGVFVASLKVENCEESDVDIEEHGDCMEMLDDGDNETGKASDRLSEQSGNDSSLCVETDNGFVTKVKSEKISNVEIANSVEVVEDVKKQNSFTETVLNNESESSFEGTGEMKFDNQLCKELHSEVEPEGFENCINSLVAEDAVGMNKIEIGEVTFPSNISINSEAKEVCAGSEEIKLSETLGSYVSKEKTCDLFEAKDCVGINKVEIGEASSPSNISVNSIAKEICAGTEEDIKLSETLGSSVSEKKTCDSLEAEDAVGVIETENSEVSSPSNISENSLAKEVCADTEDIKLPKILGSSVSEEETCDSLETEDDVGVIETENSEVTSPTNISVNSIAKEVCAAMEDDVKLSETLESSIGEEKTCNSVEAEDGVGVIKTENGEAPLPSNISENSEAKEVRAAAEEDVNLSETFESSVGEEKTCDSVASSINNVENVCRTHFAEEKPSKDEQGTKESTRQAGNCMDEDGQRSAPEGQFACDVCWKDFADSESLQVHKHVWGNVPCNLNQLQPAAQRRLSEAVIEDKPLGVGLHVSNCDPPVKSKYKCSACDEFFYHPFDLKAHRCARKSKQLEIRYEITQVLGAEQSNLDRMQVVEHMTVDSSNEFVTNPQSIVLDETADSNQMKVIEDGKLVTKQISVSSGRKLVRKPLMQVATASESTVAGQKVNRLVCDKPFVSDQESVKPETSDGSDEKDVGQTPVIIYQPIIIPTIVPMIVNSSTSWGT